MEIKDIIEYIEKTPANTNPNVLETMLQELGGGSGSSIYSHRIEIKGETPYVSSGEEVDQYEIDIIFVIYNNDSTQINTLSAIADSLLGREFSTSAKGHYSYTSSGNEHFDAIMLISNEEEQLQGYFEKTVWGDVSDCGWVKFSTFEDKIDTITDTVEAI